MYERAVTDVARADAGNARRQAATTWAKILAVAAEPDTLFALLGKPDFVDSDVSVRCRMKRTQRILIKNRLTRLGLLANTRIKDLKRIPGCGPASLIDVLAATLLAIVDDPDSAPLGLLPLPDLDKGLGASAAPMVAERVNSLDSVSDPLLDMLESR